MAVLNTVQYGIQYGEPHVIQLLFYIVMQYISKYETEIREGTMKPFLLLIPVLSARFVTALDRIFSTVFDTDTINADMISLFVI